MSAVDDILTQVEEKLTDRERAELVRRLRSSRRGAGRPRARKPRSSKPAQIERSWRRLMAMAGRIRSRDGVTDVSANKYRYVGEAIATHKLDRP